MVQSGATAAGFARLPRCMPRAPLFRSEWLAPLIASGLRRSLIGLAVLALVARVALPHVLLGVFEEQLDSLLRGRVVLEDLSLSLLRGSITLRGLSIFDSASPDLAETGTARSIPADVAYLHPHIEIDRLELNLSWWALASRTLRVEALTIDGFRVRLDRTAEGLSHAALPKPSEPAEVDRGGSTSAEATAASREGSWSFAADRVRLAEGRVSYRDRVVGKDFEVGVRELTASDLSMSFEGTAPRFRGRALLEAVLDEGSLRVESVLDPESAELAVATSISFRSFPVTDAHLYLPAFAWDGLRGTLDGSLVHRYQAGRVHELAGAISLAALQVEIPELAEPALAWDELRVAVEGVDLLRRQVALSEVELIGLRLPLEPFGDSAVPLLAAGSENAQPEAAVSARAQTATSEPVAWDWRVDRLALRDAQLQLRGVGEPLPISLETSATNLGGSPGQSSQIELRLGAASGEVALRGELGIEPLGFAGELEISDLELAPFVASSGILGAEVLERGRLHAGLRLELERGAEPAENRAPLLRASGTLGLSQLWLEASGSTEDAFAAGWRELGVELTELSLPLARGASTPPTEILVRLGRLDLIEPVVQLSRSTGGIAIPIPRSAASGAAAPDGMEASPAPNRSSPSEAGLQSEEGVPPPLRLEVSALQVAGGRAELLDQTTEPAMRSTLDRIDVEGAEIRWPELAAKRFRVMLLGLSGSTVDLSGEANAGTISAELALSDLALPQFNPYLQQTGYRVRSGELAVRSRARIEESRYEAPVDLVVSQLDVGALNGASTFEQTFGLPLSLALSLLQDLNGEISLSLPVSGDRSGARIDLVSGITQSLRSAILGALQSPLKLLGGIVQGGKVRSLDPSPITFLPGASELAPFGEERIAVLRELLETAPSLRLSFSGETGLEDVRWIRQSELLAELTRGAGAPVDDAMRNAVIAHLRERLARREPPALTPEQRSWLDQRISSLRFPAEVLRTLARDRSLRARILMLEQAEGAAARLTVVPAPIEPGRGIVGVSIQIDATRASVPSE